MIVPVPASDLDYQTVFQIVATFEAFSVWKGARAFKTDAFTNIGGGDMPIFDENTFRTACEELKDGAHKIRQVYAIGKMLLKHSLRCARHRAFRSFSFCFWAFVSTAHRFLVVTLRATPIFTIPLLSLSYLLQCGCSGTEFRSVAIVVWFIAIKTFCYLVCWLFATMIIRHIRVKAPSSDEQGIDPAPKTKWPLRSGR